MASGLDNAGTGLADSADRTCERSHLRGGHFGRISSAVAVSGERFKNAAKRLQLCTWLR
jgi:hypothetical protein